MNRGAVYVPSSAYCAHCLPDARHRWPRLRRGGQATQYPVHLRGRSVLQDAELLSRSARLGQDAQHRQAGRARRPLHARLSRRLVHAFPRESAHRAIAARHRVDDAWPASIPAASTIRLNARSSRPCSGRTATTPPRSASGTPAPTPATAATGTTRSSGTGRLHPDNAGNYYKDQILTFNGEERQVSGYSTDNYTEWAVEYIEGQHRQPDKPWYLWLCYGAVHGPTTPAERHMGKYAGNAAPVPKDIFGPWPDKPAYPGEDRGLGARQERQAHHEAACAADGQLRQGRGRPEVRRLGAAGQRVRAGRRRRRGPRDEGAGGLRPACQHAGRLHGRSRLRPRRARFSSEGGGLRRHDLFAADHQPARHAAARERSASIRSTRPTWSRSSATPPESRYPGRRTAATSARC